MPLECLGNYDIEFLADTFELGGKHEPHRFKRKITPFISFMNLMNSTEMETLIEILK